MGADAWQQAARSATCSAGTSAPALSMLTALGIDHAEDAWADDIRGRLAGDVVT